MSLDKSERKILLFSILVFILVGLPYVMSDRQVWFDESFSYLYSKQSVGYVLTPHDVHPPVYYLTLKGWTTMFGIENWVMRLLSLATGLVAFIFMFYISRELFPGEQWKRIWGYFAIIYIFSSTTMHFFSEIRMYSLAIMLVTMSFYFMLKFINSDGKKYSGWFFFISAIMMFTHYYTSIFFAVECLYILLSLKKKLINKVFIVNATLFAMYLLFLASYFMAQRSRIFGMWFSDSDWYSLISTFYYYFFHSWGIAIPAIDSIYGMMFVIGYILLIFWGISMAKGDNKKHMLMLSLFMFIPPFVGMIINDWVMRVYHHRFFIFGAWCTMLLLAASLYELEKKRKYAFLIVFALIAMLMGFNAMAYFNGFDVELKEANQYLLDHEICITNATIVHESMFSLGPSLYYQDLYNCKNIHYIYVDIPPIARNSAGYDAIGSWRLFENEDASQHIPFYYFSHKGNVGNGTTACEQLYGQDLSGVYGKGGLFLEYCVGVQR